MFVWLPCMCVIFLFIFCISQIWEFVYISNMLYFACNDRYLVWFSSTYTSHKEKREWKQESWSLVSVWIEIKVAFSIPRFPFFCMNSNFIWVHCLCTVHVLKNIKNESHGTIHTFKNYFATVLSVFSFQFQQQ